MNMKRTIPILRVGRGLGRQSRALAQLFLVLCVTTTSPGRASAQAQGGLNAVAQPIHVRLRLDGLHPRSISVPEGPAEVVFTNPTFLQAFDFVLIDKSNGRAVRQTLVASRKFRNRHSLKVPLTPGQYTIQVVGHPEWSSTLTVNPRGR